MCGALVCAARVPVVLEGKRCRRLGARQNGRLAHTSTPPCHPQSRRGATAARPTIPDDATPKVAFQSFRPQASPPRSSLVTQQSQGDITRSHSTPPTGHSPPKKHHHQENHPPPTPQLHPQPPILTMSQQEKISVYNLAGKPPPHPLPPHPNLTPPPQSRPKKHNRRRHPQLPQLPLLPPIPHPLRRPPHPRLPRPPHRRRLLRLGLQARLRSDETPDRRGRRPLRRAQHRSHRVDLPRRARRRLRRNLPRWARARAHHERVGQGKGSRV